MYIIEKFKGIRLILWREFVPRVLYALRYFFSFSSPHLFKSRARAQYIMTRVELSMPWFHYRSRRIKRARRWVGHFRAFQGRPSQEYKETLLILFNFQRLDLLFWTSTSFSGYIETGKIQVYNLIFLKKIMFASRIFGVIRSCSNSTVSFVTFAHTIYCYQTMPIYSPFQNLRMYGRRRSIAVERLTAIPKSTVSTFSTNRTAKDWSTSTKTVRTLTILAKSKKNSSTPICIELRIFQNSSSKSSRIR